MCDYLGFGKLGTKEQSLPTNSNLKCYWIYWRRVRSVDTLPGLVSNFSRNASSFPPFSIIMPMGLLHIVFICWDMSPLSFVFLHFLPWRDAVFCQRLLIDLLKWSCDLFGELHLLIFIWWTITVGIGNKQQNDRLMHSKFGLKVYYFLHLCSSSRFVYNFLFCCSFIVQLTF